VRNGIALVSEYERLDEREEERFGPGLVARRTRERLAPILTTAVVAGLALLPLVLSGAIAGQEIVHPMAVVVLGGLATSTSLNLFIMPGLYVRFGRRRVSLPAEGDA
jgi:Cu/Ag efflux pump CusA